MPGHKLDRLPDELLSSTQLYQVVSELGSLVDAKSKSKAKASKLGLAQDLPESVSYFFRKPPTLTQLSELKDQLEKIIQTAPAVKLTLSDSPSLAFNRKLAAWFRQIHPYCLIEVLVDNTIIGGVIVRSGRRVFDYSIRTQLAGAESSLTGILADA